MKIHLLGGLLLLATGCSSADITPPDKPVDLLLKVEWTGVVTRPPVEAGFATQGSLAELNAWKREALPQGPINEEPMTGLPQFNWRTGSPISSEDASRIRELLATPDFAAHRVSRPDPMVQQYVITLRDGKQNATYLLGLDEIALDLLWKLQRIFQKNEGACLQPVIDQLTKWNIHVKTHVARFGVGLDLPSRKWGNYELGPDFHGVNAIGDSTSIYVEKVPGVAKHFMQNVLSDLPEGSKISREEITTFGRFNGTGTRIMITYPDRRKDNTECVLFYPKGELEGYFIAMRINEPSVALNQTDAANIIESIRKEP